MSHHDERTPLLADTLAKPRIPPTQLLILCWARISQNWSYYGCFSFMPAFVRSTGIPEREIGYYAGLVDSSLAFAQFFALIFWSGRSKKYGRKPVLSCCLAGLPLSSLLFGFSTKVWHMILCRTLAGVFSACSLTVRVMVSESTTPETRPQAYAYQQSAAQLAIIVAPLMGGLLWDPTHSLEWLSRRLPILGSHPALLPSMLNSAIIAGALVAVLLGVAETRSPSKTAEAARTMSHRDLLGATGVLTALAIFAWSGTMGEAVAAVNPVMYHTSVGLGGYSFSTREISVLMASVGFIGTVWSAVGVGRLLRRFGPVATLGGASVSYICNFTWPMFANELLRHGHAILFWTFLPLFVAVQACNAAITGVAAQLLINDVVPPEAVGSINGLAVSLYAFQGIFVPTASTSLFALGVQKQALRGHLAYAVITAWAVGYTAYTKLNARRLQEICNMRESDSD